MVEGQVIKIENIPEEEMSRWQDFLKENPRIKTCLSQKVDRLESFLHLAQFMTQIQVEELRKLKEESRQLA